MAEIEIDSFVRKFKLLWAAGHDAVLSLDSKLGAIHIDLNCKIGRIVPPPATPLMNDGFTLNKRMSPSRQRRRARRAAVAKENVAAVVNDQVVAYSEEESVLDGIVNNDVQQDPDLINVEVLNGMDIKSNASVMTETKHMTEESTSMI